MQKLERITEETLKQKGPYNEVLLKDAYDLYVNGKFYPYDWVENFNIINPVSLLTAFRKRGWPKQLDFKLIDYPIAIEINGLYNHSVDGRNKDFDIEYHLEKFKGCYYNGTMLLSFTDFEIDHCFEFVKDVILYHLGLDDQSKVFKEFEKIKDSIDMESGEFTRSCNYGVFWEVETINIEGITIKPRSVNGYTYYDSGLLALEN